MKLALKLLTIALMTRGVMTECYQYSFTNDSGITLPMVKIYASRGGVSQDHLNVRQGATVTFDTRAGECLTSVSIGYPAHVLQTVSVEQLPQYMPDFFIKRGPPTGSVCSNASGKITYEGGKFKITKL